MPRIAPFSIQFSPRRPSAPTLSTPLANPGLAPRIHLNRILCASAATPATPGHGMNPQLRDYLARRAIPRCSLRYYRTSPAPNDTHYEPFKKSVPSAPSIPAPPHPRSSAQRRPDNLYIDHPSKDTSAPLCFTLILVARYVRQSHWEHSVTQQSLYHVSIRPTRGYHPVHITYDLLTVYITFRYGMWPAH